MASFEHLLAECLEDLSQTGGVEASLQSHPQQADSLRPLLEMAQAAHDYYQVVPAAPDGLVAGRERLLAAARVRQAAAATEGTPAKIAGRPRLRLGFSLRLIALVLAAALVTVSLGSGLVWAAGDSLPGHLLYPLKLATEDVRLALASEPADDVDLALAFVEERAGELQALAAVGSGIPSGAVTRMERHVERALAQAAGADDEKMGGLLEQIVKRTREQAQRLDGLQANVSQQAQAGLGHAAAVCRRGAEAAEQGLSDPSSFRWRYRHAEGEPEPIPEPELRQERHQQRNQDEDSLDERTPAATPTVTPRSPRASRTPRVTPERPRASVTPQPTPTSQHKNHKNMEPTGTRAGPRATATETTTEPKGTPRHSEVTATPAATSHAPRATDEPKPTAQGPHATATPQSAPQDPPPTPGHPRETHDPHPPGGGNH
jgi:hypothetical protein